jgi:glycosyltransferase involved in cell wall biosynthesis
MMKTALIHDWLVSQAGGAEKVFEAIYRLFPSEIYTLVKSQESIRDRAFARETIHSSFIESLPFGRVRHRTYLPLFPLAIEQFDLSSYDLIISSSHCVAKGVLTHADQLHLCYCHTPMRYAWDLTHQYLREEKGWKAGKLARLFLHYLRSWDFCSTPRVDAFAVNSHHVAKRVKKIYGRESTVIYPPVEIDFFEMRERKEDFYVTASRMVPYKKIDLIVEAFSSMPDKRLVVVGDGPEFAKIKAKAGKNIELLGYQSDVVLEDLLERAKAFVFAGIEDFGIVLVEAQACGTPVIALGKGASLETVREGETGVFFREQTVQELRDAVFRFEKMEWDGSLIRAHAETFGSKRFAASFTDWVLKETNKERYNPDYDRSFKENGRPLSLQKRGDESLLERGGKRNLHSHALSSGD